MKSYFLIVSFLIIACSCTSRQNKSTQSIAEIDSVQTITYDTTRFDFEPDIRLFTLMAFGNASGYDYENSYMSPERKELREYLDSVLTDDFKEKINGLNKKNAFYNLGIIAFNLSYPPNFQWLPDSLGITYPFMEQTDITYLRLLNEFYVNADIPKLWKKYEAILHDYHYEFVPFTNGITDIVNYCRVDSNYFGATKFVLQICPFMQSESGFTCRSSSSFYIVATPRQAGPEVLYHEPLHYIVNPLIGKYSKELWKIKNASKIGIEIRMKTGGEYLGIDGLAAESLVRTIDYILRAKYYNWTEEETMEKINKQYAMGLTLIPFFFEELKKYKNSELTLDEYFPIMIKNYNLQKEEARWEKFVSSEKHESQPME